MRYRAQLEHSPIGAIGLEADDTSLLAVHFLPHQAVVAANETDAPILLEAIQQLQQYFDGSRQQFSLPLRFKGTAFQQQVWQQLLRIPYGSTCSYGDIAKALGNPGAARAVGMANNQNPLPIVIPCHRVIGHNGKLVGFGGGIAIKQKLLQLEQQQQSLF